MAGLLRYVKVARVYSDRPGQKGCREGARRKAETLPPAGGEGKEDALPLLSAEDRAGVWPQSHFPACPPAKPRQAAAATRGRGGMQKGPG